MGCPVAMTAALRSLASNKQKFSALVNQNADHSKYYNNIIIGFIWRFLGLHDKSHVIVMRISSVKPVL